MPLLPCGGEIVAREILAKPVKIRSRETDEIITT